MISPLSGLARHFVNANLLDETQALNAEYKAKKSGVHLVRYLTENHLIESEHILKTCAEHFGLPIFDLKNYDSSWLQHSPLNPEFLRRYRVIPLQKKNNLFHIGISDPTDQATLDAVIFHTGLQIVPFLVSEKQLNYFLDNHIPLASSKYKELSLLNQLNSEKKETVELEDNMTSEEPLIQFVDHIIQHALQQLASDIHIEPLEKECRIRYRQDGLLYEIMTISSHIANRLITRLKVMAKLDIAERRLPQDGRFHTHDIDIRMNTCPTLFGEKIVLRLLNSSKITLDINQLGLNEFQKQIFLRYITRPHGMILVTGPTGSGKTVTLYSALHYLNHSEKNISSVEDPIEIQLRGINQVNIHPKIGLDFATVLRTFLRQDPDILMVGEIRDTETANVAIQAAQTGHLVFSTLHTNSAIEAIVRLKAMGIASYNLVNSISLIIAQRLIRKLCVHCKQIEKLTDETLREMELSSSAILFRAQGCQHCLQGYKGKTAIYEFLPITENITELILSNANSADFLVAAQREGFQSLFESSLEKMIHGITSLSEINRVTLK